MRITCFSWRARTAQIQFINIKYDTISTVNEQNIIYRVYCLELRFIWRTNEQNRLESNYARNVPNVANGDKHKQNLSK